MRTHLSGEASAWELLERLRWPEGNVVCPHCGVVDAAHYFIAARSGARTTRTGAITYRRLWRCRSCRKQFSVLVGTICESSKIPVSTWLRGMWLFHAGENGVSAVALQRQLGIAYQSAWSMAHRLREAATRRPLATLVGGTIVSDEVCAPAETHLPTEASTTCTTREVDFEELVAATLKVDPKGLSGKHRKAGRQRAPGEEAGT